MALSAAVKVNVLSLLWNVTHSLLKQGPLHCFFTGLCIVCKVSGCVRGGDGGGGGVVLLFQNPAVH